MLKKLLLKKINTKFIILLLVLITALVYVNSLKNNFVWDDYFVIVDNSFIKSWHNFPEIFSKSYLTPITVLKSGNITGSGETSYRPVVTASYFVDYWLWKLNPSGYHLLNLLLHIANVILLYLFICLLLKNKYIAFLASLFFALHPVNTEVVNVVSFREDLFVFLFFVSAFILFIKQDLLSGRKKMFCRIFSIILFLLALFSKEVAIMLPVMLILYDYLFVFNQQWRKLFTCCLSRYGGYLLAVIFYLAVWFNLKSGISDFIAEYPYPGGNFYTNFLTMSGVFLQYTSWLIFPVNIHATLPENTPGFTLYSIFRPEAFFPIILIIFLLLTAFIYHRKSKEISFSIFWFFIMLLPVSNIIPISCIMASRYLYIPMVGFCIALAVICFKLLPRFNKFVRNAVIVLIIFYSIFSFIRNSVWNNNVTVWKELVEYYPQVPEAHINFAGHLKKIGLLDQAKNEYRIAIQINPYSPVGYNFLGLTLGQEGRYQESVEYFKKAIDLDKKYLCARNNLAVTYANMMQWDKARAMWLEALKIDPAYEEAKHNLEKLKQLGK